MQRLVECLRAVESSRIPDTPETRLDPVHHRLVIEIQFIAARFLITDKGEPEFDEIDRLHKEYGYFVVPGDRDRFGWVTACIQTKKGFIVFG